MPKIKEYHEIDISLEKFLRACSDTELYEITLLLARRDYAERIARVEGSYVRDCCMCPFDQPAPCSRCQSRIYTPKEIATLASIGLPEPREE